ncbi:MAG: hypothetical protein GEU90_08050 [Gemmatimonas sp.]|nr:hypothetical protein [Gemmatimonas sp.]
MPRFSSANLLGCLLDEASYPTAALLRSLEQVVLRGHATLESLLDGSDNLFGAGSRPQRHQ